MFRKSVIVLGAAIALATALGSAASAQQTAEEWQRAYQASQNSGWKGCVSGEEDTTSANPSWMVCR